MLLFCCALLLNVLLFAQDLNPVKWTYEAVQTNEGSYISLVAEIKEGWYVYAQEIPEGGPIPTSFQFETDGAISFPEYATVVSEHSITNYDELFGMDLTKYKNNVSFNFPLPKETTVKTVKGSLEFMCCDGTQCLAPQIIEFTINLK